MIRLRATALITFAALALHELRYVVGYGSHAHEALASQGHGYLRLAVWAAGALLALAAAQLLANLGRAWRTGAGDGVPLPLGLAWLTASLTLTGVYTGQELLEGALVAGHPGGASAIVAHGGLVAYPLAFVFGAIVALALRGAHAVVGAVARRAPGRHTAAAPAAVTRAPASLDLVRVGALAGGRPVRGPPLAS